MQKDQPLRKTDIEVKEVGNETLLVDGQDIHVLNPTAALIWKLCDGTHTLEAMAAALSAEYEIPAEHDVIADVKRTLEDFKRKSLLDEV